MTVIAVCGLVTEAKRVGGPGVTVLVGGSDQARLQHDLQRLAPTCRAILSIGVAGALAPDLKAGTVCVADAVVVPTGESMSTDPRWTEAMSRVLGAPALRIAGVDAPVGSVSAKSELHRQTGAHLVDMESHIVARVASVCGLPFAALRIVTDAADRPLPHAATVGMRADGRVDLAAILRSLARHPGQLPDLIRTGLDARVAFAALLRSRQRLGPDFAFLDFG